ncbi:hypothetical protein Bbelb_267260 [Branchiostoma belcheri]|nr:hypothetical protein Bbelb_267260 [Branchiostoma belcheri]
MATDTTLVQVKGHSNQFPTFAQPLAFPPKVLKHEALAQANSSQPRHNLLPTIVRQCSPDQVGRASTDHAANHVHSRPCSRPTPNHGWGELDQCSESKATFGYVAEKASVFPILVAGFVLKKQQTEFGTRINSDPRSMCVCVAWSMVDLKYTKAQDIMRGYTEADTVVDYYQEAVLVKAVAVQFAQSSASQNRSRKFPYL